MKNPIIYALDFDGVICDSAVETGITGWKAATRIWTDMTGDLPEQELIDQFRRVRPVIETGYESIPVMRMLYQGDGIDSIFAEFSEKKQKLIEHSGKSVDYFKKLFGETRDLWIENALHEWLNMNPLFPGVAEKLSVLDEQHLWYIVTTKQERFVSQILASNGIHLPKTRIFGLDRNMSKVGILLELINKHPDSELHFIEDRLPTLLKVLQNNELRKIKLFFADWGYNTIRDKSDAWNHTIESIDIHHFLV